jgi:hypothetical protein
VAFMVAFSQLPSAERQIKFLDDLFEIISSPSLSSLKRMEEVRDWLMKNQSVVTFMHSLQTALLEPLEDGSFMELPLSSSNQPKSKKKRLNRRKFEKNLEYYVLEVSKQTTDS